MKNRQPETCTAQCSQEKAKAALQEKQLAALETPWRIVASTSMGGPWRDSAERRVLCTLVRKYTLREFTRRLCFCSGRNRHRGPAGAFEQEPTVYFDVSGDDPERVYQALVLGLLVQLEQDYRLRSEREAGDGRADVLLIPKQPNQPGIILEFKLAASVWGEKNQAVVEQGLQQTAQAALQQN